MKELGKRENEHHLASRNKELESRRTKLSKRLAKHFETQSKIMPTVTTSHKPKCVDDTILDLPSDFTAKERLDLQLEGIAREEKFLREGEIVDAIAEVRDAAQLLSSLPSRKRRVARHQRENMREESKCAEQAHLLDEKIAHYNYARLKLLKLRDDDPRFPPLTVATLSGSQQIYDGR